MIQPQPKEEEQTSKILLTNDRILKIKPMEGKTAISTTGLVDNRLFTGEVTLHAIRDNNSLWSLRYSAGLIPEPLRMRFTNFKKLMDHAKTYFNKRNIEISE